MSVKARRKKKRLKRSKNKKKIHHHRPSSIDVLSLFSPLLFSPPSNSNYQPNPYLVLVDVEPPALLRLESEPGRGRARGAVGAGREGGEGGGEEHAESFFYFRKGEKKKRFHETSFKSSSAYDSRSRNTSASLSSSSPCRAEEESEL